MRDDNKSKEIINSKQSHCALWVVNWFISISFVLVFNICWIRNYNFYNHDEKTKQIDFGRSHCGIIEMKNGLKKSSCA